MADDTNTTPPEQKHGHGTRHYWVIWGVLMVLTALTIVGGRAQLSPPVHVGVALTIAVVKATLVALFFMHLWDSEGINRLVFGVAVVFVALLAIGVLGDVGARLRTALPPGVVPPVKAEASGEPPRGEQPSGKAAGQRPAPP